VDERDLLLAVRVTDRRAQVAARLDVGTNRAAHTEALELLERVSRGPDSVRGPENRQIREHRAERHDDATDDERLGDLAGYGVRDATDRRSPHPILTDAERDLTQPVLPCVELVTELP